MLHKALALTDCEVKFSGDKARAFEGYASVFGGVDSYGDTILRGAYSDTLKDRKSAPAMLHGHMRTLVIGKWTHMEEDEKGLRVRGELTPGHTEAENVLASMKHGAINGLSIGFYVPEGGAKWSEDYSQRTISKIDLREISVVSMPADSDARIDLASIKAAVDECKQLSEIEDYLRDAGNFSRSSAKHLVARIRELTLRDAGGGGGANGGGGSVLDLSALSAIPKSIFTS